MIFEYVKALIYGFVEGISEWLPISSTGHLILLERVIPLDIGSQNTALADQYSSMFDVVIQLGAILAVLCLYFKRLVPFCTKNNKSEIMALWGRLILSTIPAALVGIGADALCERFLGCDVDTLLFRPQVVACALIIYGILFIIVERLTKPQDEKAATPIPTVRSAFAIGCFQTLAIIPGTSRSGATILGARILGMPRKTAAEFSFFAAIPVIASASLLKTVEFAEYAIDSEISISAEAFFILLIASVSAFVISLLTIRLLTDFVKKHSFISFGVYRILLGTAVLFFVK